MSMLSIIIPLCNEEGNVEPLYRSLKTALAAFGRPYEIICVNDGSEDETESRLNTLAGTDPLLKIVSFRRNLGQTAALMAGFSFAKGDIIIPMDGDLQNDPADVGLLVAKLEEGYDVVSGWRKERKDSMVRRNLPSLVANWLISRISGVHLHDYGCTLKAYRRDAVKDVRLYGQMHRFIPIYASWHGGRITELPVQHHPRTQGKSKYGLDRVIKVILDLIVVKFLSEYNTTPIYIFGFSGIICILISILSGLWAVFLKVFENVSFIQTPLPLLVVLSFITGILCILLGLIAEMLVRIYYETQNKPIYQIRSTVNLETID